MRVFIAIELDDKIKKKLSVAQEEVKTSSIKGKYTAANNFHLTLYFIGEVKEAKIEEIKSVIANIAEQSLSFELSLNTLGHFQKKQKHIIWVGVKGNTDPLYKLNKDIKNELEDFKQAEEELAYTPHITLGRQIVIPHSFSGLRGQIKMPEIAIRVNAISLMESKREDGELVYKPIYSKSLKMSCPQ